MQQLLMSECEWVLRCQREFARATNTWQQDWNEQAVSCYRDYYLDYLCFLDDPEGAAQEEISQLPY